jgi:cytochrome oxidase assembly protein ShyY1
MARRQTIAAQRVVARSRRRPIKQRFLLVLIALAIILLALGGWAVKGLRLGR